MAFVGAHDECNIQNRAKRGEREQGTGARRICRCESRKFAEQDQYNRSECGDRADAEQESFGPCAVSGQNRRCKRQCGQAQISKQGSQRKPEIDADMAGQWLGDGCGGAAPDRMVNRSERDRDNLQDHPQRRQQSRSGRRFADRKAALNIGFRRARQQHQQERDHQRQQLRPEPSRADGENRRRSDQRKQQSKLQGEGVGFIHENITGAARNFAHLSESGGNQCRRKTPSSRLVAIFT